MAVSHFLILFGLISLASGLVNIGTNTQHALRHSIATTNIRSSLFSTVLDDVEQQQQYTTNTDAAASRAAEANQFQIELDATGLSRCHGILHASGCRRLSDLGKLTPNQITSMGANVLDLPIIQELNEMMYEDRFYNGNMDDDAGLSTLIDGAFVNTRKLSRFEVPTPHDFQFEVICAENDIFKGRLFSLDQCAQLNRMSEYHAYKENANNSPSTSTSTSGGWTNEIYTLTAQHMACKSVPGFIPTTNDIFRQLLRKLPHLYQGRFRKGSVQFENDGEPHLVKYNGKAKGTVLHTDCEDEYAAKSITINALLSPNEDFGGGGTYISAIDETIKLEQGEMLIHLGNLEHAGVEIDFGVRRLLVAFMKCEWEDSGQLGVAPVSFN